jgi:hypothetical protein
MQWKCGKLATQSIDKILVLDGVKEVSGKTPVTII